MISISSLFKKNGYVVVKNVISQQLLDNLKIQFKLYRDIKIYETKNKDLYAFSDDQSLNCFSVYSALFFESLALQLNDLMSEITGLNLLPTYSYARIYYSGSILEPHVDRPSCEYSTTICIDSTDIWDFYIEDKNGKQNKVKLNPGDMCIYRGCDLLHWRKKYEGKEQIQCFLHYIDSEGPNKEWKYDKRPGMGLFSNEKSNVNYQYKYKSNLNFIDYY